MSKSSSKQFSLYDSGLVLSSVEQLPTASASVAFTVDSAKVFREDVDIVPVTLSNGIQYMPWGGDNLLPYHVLNLIEKDETLSTCQIFAIEDRMADEYLSPELLEHLRHQLCTAPAEITGAETKVLKQVRSEIINMLNGFPPNREHLFSIVNFIRQHEDEFPLWHASDTAKLFTPPIFENKKRAAGYWF